MRYLLLVFTLIIPVLVIQAQVGINTINPKVTLDVRGENDANGNPGALAITDGILVPRVTDLAVDGVKDGQLVFLIANAGAFTKGFHFWDGEWKPITPNVVAGGELERLSEAGQTGYRLKEANPLFYGNIGSNAIDLSISTNNSSTRGATGVQSFAAGRWTTASGNYATAMGRENNAESYGQTSLGFLSTNHDGTPNPTTAVGTDRLLVVGNGAIGARSDALLILKNGLITAPSLSPSMISTGDNKTLTTKEWVAANTGSGELQKITENGSSGYRKRGVNPDHYGNIGLNAMDFSHSFLPSTTLGATGTFSFASGLFTTAAGKNSTAMGESVTAESYGQTSMGIFGTSESWGDPDNIYFGDRLFQIGNGTAINDRSDALVIYKDGGMVAPSLTAAKINLLGDHALTTREWVMDNDVNELEKITEGGRTGYRLAGQDPAAYGNIGINAVDFSSSTVASSTNGATGSFSLALGSKTEASGDYSLAFGSEAEASGFGSFAMGVSSVASSNKAMALGDYAVASSPGTIALGYRTMATDISAVAIGYETKASGRHSLALGKDTEASGHNSTSAGEGTTAESDGQTTIGFFNTELAGTAPTDASRLFVIGNGAFDARSDALIMQRNGNTVFSGTITAPAFIPSSDRRLKTNIEPLTAGMSTLNKIDTYQYNFKKGDTERVHYGVIAQELQEVLPNLVNEQTSGEKMLGVNYTELIPIVINALKEQQTINRELQEAGTSLQAEVASLNDKYNEILALLGKSTSGKK